MSGEILCPRCGNSLSPNHQCGPQKKVVKINLREVLDDILKKLNEHEAGLIQHKERIEEQIMWLRTHDRMINDLRKEINKLKS